MCAFDEALSHTLSLSLSSLNSCADVTTSSLVEFPRVEEDASCASEETTVAYTNFDQLVSALSGSATVLAAN